MGLTFLQAPALEGSNTGTSTTKAFASNVAANSIMFAYGLAVTADPVTFTVTDSKGNTWAQIGTNQLNTSYGATQTLGLFWAKNTNGAGANTVTLTSTVSTFLEVCVAEYSGQYTAGNPIDNSAFFSYDGSFLHPTVGPVLLTAQNESFIAFGRFNVNNIPGSPSGADGTVRLDVSTGHVFLEDRAVASTGNQTASWTQSASNQGGSVFAFGVFSATSVFAYSVSGNVGVAGATVSYSGTSSGAVTSDGSGNYNIPNLVNGSYTVTPSKTAYSFAPVNRPVTVSSADVTGVNFTPTHLQVSTPTSSPAAGTYFTAQSVTLLDVDSGLSGFAMYYTTDGTTPTRSSTLYTVPIGVVITTVIKAFAVATGVMDSDVLTATYSIVSGAGGGILLLE